METNTQSPPEPAVPAPAPEVKPKTCAIEQVLAPATLKLLSLHPEHEVYRTLALAELKRPLPDEAKTWEQIVDWVEHHLTVPKGPPTLTPAQGVSVDVQYREYVTGNCTYRSHNSGLGNYHLDPGILRDTLQDAIDNDDTWTQFLDRIEDEARRLCQDNTPDTDSEGGFNYDNHEDSETISSEQNIRNQAGFHDDVRAWLVRNGLADAVRELEESE